MAAYLHEVSGGRFQFGIGVAHGPTHVRMGVTPGKPLADIRAFVAKLRSYKGIGALPPAIPAAKRADPNFFIGNRIRTCISDDEAEAKSVLRRTVTNYALMANYRHYWKEAGYLEE